MNSSVVIGFKLCQAWLDACFIQKVLFLLWPSDPDTVDDTDRIVHIIDSSFLQMPKKSEYVWMAHLDSSLHRSVTQNIKIQSSSWWSVIFHPLLVGSSLSGPAFSSPAFSVPFRPVANMDVANVVCDATDISYGLICPNMVMANMVCGRYWCHSQNRYTLKDVTQSCSGHSGCSEQSMTDQTASDSCSFAPAGCGLSKETPAGALSHAVITYTAPGGRRKRDAD